MKIDENGTTLQQMIKYKISSSINKFGPIIYIAAAIPLFLFVVAVANLVVCALSFIFFSIYYLVIFRFPDIYIDRDNFHIKYRKKQLETVARNEVIGVGRFLGSLCYLQIKNHKDVFFWAKTIDFFKEDLFSIGPNKTTPRQRLDRILTKFSSH